ncbi:MAG: arginine deiminase-related protein [Pseudomonadota bacterium]
MTVHESQLAGTVLMIRPARFEANPETAGSNAFMENIDLPAREQQRRALEQFESLAAALAGAGVNVVVVDDTPEPHTPDSVFPNNWISMHADGRVVLYPMEAVNRRTERRLDVLDLLNERHGFQVGDVIDLSAHERDGHYLEGTGSLVLDRQHRVAYACLSSRTQLDALGDFAQRLDYDIVAFDAVDRNGQPIYHTNVLMSIGEELAFICAECIPDEAQRAAVLSRLEATGHRVMPLSYAQLEAFAGNMLELRAADGARVVALSQQAFDSLDTGQRDALAANGRLAIADIRDIEASAGGSVRCMLAEVHLPLA